MACLAYWFMITLQVQKLEVQLAEARAVREQEASGEAEAALVDAEKAAADLRATAESELAAARWDNSP